MEYKSIRTSAAYIAEYADFGNMEEYRRKTLTENEQPPVRFLADGKPSDAFSWVKRTGTEVSYTDFPGDEPVTRTERQDVYTCSALGLEITLTVTGYPDFPVIEYLPKIKNIGCGHSPEITELYSLNGSILQNVNAVRVHHNNGGAYMSNEYAAFTDELRPFGGQNKLYFDNRSGLCTTDHLPNFNFEDEAGDKGIICVLSWAADWRTAIEVTAGRETVVKAGTRVSDFVLLPDEEIRMPMIVLLFYRGAWIDGQNIWRHWYFRHNVLRAQGKRMRTNLLYCISTDDNGMLNNEKQNIDSVNLCVKLGLNGVTDYINQDAGWYKVKEGDCWTYTGNWEVDTERYPHGLGAIADLAHRNGMLYSVWFEPERIHAGTKMHRELGENALCPIRRDDGRLVLAKPDEVSADANLLTNYANPDVVEYTVRMLDTIIKENHIDQYRQDQNFGEIASYFEAADHTEEDRLGIKRDGITEAKFVDGYQTMWAELIARNPGLVIDSCSGGGRRNDLETVRKSFIHTRTDFYQDPDFAQCQTYGMSMWYMLMGTANIWLDDEYDRRSRIASSIGYLPEEGKWEELFSRAHTLWKGYMDCFFSNYYPLTPYTAAHDGNLAMQFDEIDRGIGFVCAYIRKSGALTIRLRGLCPEDTYFYEDEDHPGQSVRVSGTDLMEKGITLSSDTRAAFILRYRRENR